MKNKVIVIEEQDLEYRLLKNSDLSIELEVNLSIQGGLSVYHLLTDTELNGYSNFGIEFLQNKITDMNVNYYNYRVVCWR